MRQLQKEENRMIFKIYIYICYKIFVIFIYSTGVDLLIEKPTYLGEGNKASSFSKYSEKQN